MSEAVKKIQELMKLPQKLCNMCGKCCQIATYKGGRSYEEILEIIENPESDPAQVEGAKDFLAIFMPCYSHETIKEIEPEFYEKVMKQTGKPSMSFFRCRYIGEHGGCLIHEDRPSLCRMYPIPHERTIFFPGCGFEKQSIENWEKIQEIVKEVRERHENVTRQYNEAKNKLS